MRRWLTMGAWTVAMAMASVAHASTPPAASAPADKVVYKKKTVIDLTGVMIEGQLTKPEGAYVVNRRVSEFSTLIKLRKNFLPELSASADLL